MVHSRGVGCQPARIGMYGGGQCPRYDGIRHHAETSGHSCATAGHGRGQAGMGHAPYELHDTASRMGVLVARTSALMVPGDGLLRFEGVCLPPVAHRPRARRCGSRMTMATMRRMRTRRRWEGRMDTIRHAPMAERQARACQPPRVQQQAPHAHSAAVRHACRS